MKIEDVKLALYCNTTESCECCVEFDGTDDDTCIKKVDRITAMILQAEIERLENKPLTVEELKRMIGEPVWAQGYDYTDLKTGEGCWIFVESVDFDGFFFENAIIRGTYGDTLYDENTFYKHKPKED